MQTVSRPTIVTQPVSEPITLTEALKQLELSPSDTAHSDHVAALIQAAREQFEHDTDSCILTQTLSVTLAGFCGDIQLPKRPIQSITSIAYYDSTNTTQTLSTSVYSLDAQRQLVRLKYLQTWPDTLDRWDAVTVTYVAGYASVASVPALYKQAMKLLIGHYFENRDQIMSEAMQTMPAYEALVRRFVRSSYP